QRLHFCPLWLGGQTRHTGAESPTDLARPQPGCRCDQVGKDVSPESQRGEGTRLTRFETLRGKSRAQFVAIPPPERRRKQVQEDSVQSRHARPLRKRGFARARSTTVPNRLISPRSALHPRSVRR